jgi:hypothetical protein
VVDGYEGYEEPSPKLVRNDPEVEIPVEDPDEQGRRLATILAQQHHRARANISLKFLECPHACAALSVGSLVVEDAG